VLASASSRSRTLIARGNLCCFRANGRLYLIHTGNEFGDVDKKSSCESSAIKTSEEMHSYFATEQFLQSKTQPRRSVSSAIPVTHGQKGKVYEKTESDFADLREP
jgi:hypothetical protein